MTALALACAQRGSQCVASGARVLVLPWGCVLRVRRPVPPGVLLMRSPRYPALATAHALSPDPGRLRREVLAWPELLAIDRAVDLGAVDGLPPQPVAHVHVVP